ncbi:MAG: hypothetical protein ACP5OO_02045 [Chloroflexia bacterium]
MKFRLLLLLLTCGALLLGCTSRVTSTPEPPLIPAPTKAPTAIPPSPAPTPPFTQAVEGPTATPPRPTPPPQLANRPQVTVLGQLEGGIPYGVTADGHAFKGDPQAPIILFEFSDFQ